MEQSQGSDAMKVRYRFGSTKKATPTFKRVIDNSVELICRPSHFHTSSSNSFLLSEENFQYGGNSSRNPVKANSREQSRLSLSLSLPHSLSPTHSLSHTHTHSLSLYPTHSRTYFKPEGYLNALTLIALSPIKS